MSVATSISTPNNDNTTSTTAGSTSITTTLVVGATGGTGRWVVKLLLDQGHSVKVVVRSKTKMLSILQEMNHDGNQDNTPNSNTNRLVVTEASLLDLSDAALKELVKDCDAVVSCLGHAEIWGPPRKLVTEATQRLTAAISAVPIQHHDQQQQQTPNHDNKKTKFILLSSAGVDNPNGQDDKRAWLDRALLVLIRQLVPPHLDNESAAAFVHSLGTATPKNGSERGNKNKNNNNIEWVVIRPTNMINGSPTGKFQLFDKPIGSLFGPIVTRSHVAQCMVEFILQPTKWDQYKFTMPVIHDIVSSSSPSSLDTKGKSNDL